ncbi:MAG TPA: hypothetical protein DDZ51_28965 [Planctomycetaceae bacterium]|nr:hypothetical protein [Planctomycetaceae bacterium]
MEQVSPGASIHLPTGAATSDRVHGETLAGKIDTTGLIAKPKVQTSMRWSIYRLPGMAAQL